MEVATEESSEAFSEEALSPIKSRKAFFENAFKKKDAEKTQPPPSPKWVSPRRKTLKELPVISVNEPPPPSPVASSTRVPSPAASKPETEAKPPPSPQTSAPTSTPTPPTPPTPPAPEDRNDMDEVVTTPNFSNLRDMWGAKANTKKPTVTQSWRKKSYQPPPPMPKRNSVDGPAARWQKQVSTSSLRPKMETPPPPPEIPLLAHPQKKDKKVDPQKKDKVDDKSVTEKENTHVEEKKQAESETTDSKSSEAKVEDENRPTSHNLWTKDKKQETAGKDEKKEHNLWSKDKKKQETAGKDEKKEIQEKKKEISENNDEKADSKPALVDAGRNETASALSSNDTAARDDVKSVPRDDSVNEVRDGDDNKSPPSVDDSRPNEPQQDKPEPQSDENLLEKSSSDQPSSQIDGSSRQLESAEVAASGEEMKNSRQPENLEATVSDKEMGPQDFLQEEQEAPVAPTTRELDSAPVGSEKSEESVHPPRVEKERPAGESAEKEDPVQEHSEAVEPLQKEIVAYPTSEEVPRLLESSNSTNEKERSQSASKEIELEESESEEGDPMVKKILLMAESLGSAETNGSEEHANMEQLPPASTEPPIPTIEAPNGCPPEPHEHTSDNEAASVKSEPAKPLEQTLVEASDTVEIDFGASKDQLEHQELVVDRDMSESNDQLEHQQLLLTSDDAGDHVVLGRTDYTDDVMLAREESGEQSDPKPSSFITQESMSDAADSVILARVESKGAGHDPILAHVDSQGAPDVFEASLHNSNEIEQFDSLLSAEPATAEPSKDVLLEASSAARSDTGAGHEFQLDSNHQEEAMAAAQGVGDMEPKAPAENHKETDMWPEPLNENTDLTETMESSEESAVRAPEPDEVEEKPVSIVEDQKDSLAIEHDSKEPLDSDSKIEEPEQQQLMFVQQEENKELEYIQVTAEESEETTEDVRLAPKQERETPFDELNNDSNQPEPKETEIAFSERDQTQEEVSSNEQAMEAQQETNDARVEEQDGNDELKRKGQEGNQLPSTLKTEERTQEPTIPQIPSPQRPSRTALKWRALNVETGTIERSNLTPRNTPKPDDAAQQPEDDRQVVQVKSSEDIVEVVSHHEADGECDGDSIRAPSPSQSGTDMSAYRKARRFSKLVAKKDSPRFKNSPRRLAGLTNDGQHNDPEPHKDSPNRSQPASPSPTDEASPSPRPKSGRKLREFPPPLVVDKTQQTSAKPTETENIPEPPTSPRLEAFEGCERDAVLEIKSTEDELDPAALRCVESGDDIMRETEEIGLQKLAMHRVDSVDCDDDSFQLVYGDLLSSSREDPTKDEAERTEVRDDQEETTPEPAPKPQEAPTTPLPSPLRSPFGLPDIPEEVPKNKKKDRKSTKAEEMTRHARRTAQKLREARELMAPYISDADSGELARAESFVTRAIRKLEAEKLFDDDPEPPQKDDDAKDNTEKTAESDEEKSLAVKEEAEGIEAAIREAAIKGLPKEFENEGDDKAGPENDEGRTSSRSENPALLLSASKVQKYIETYEDAVSCISVLEKYKHGEKRAAARSAKQASDQLTLRKGSSATSDKKVADLPLEFSQDEADLLGVVDANQARCLETCSIM